MTNGAHAISTAQPNEEDLRLLSNMLWEYRVVRAGFDPDTVTADQEATIPPSETQDMLDTMVERLEQSGTRTSLTPFDLKLLECLKETLLAGVSLAYVRRSNAYPLAVLDAFCRPDDR